MYLPHEKILTLGDLIEDGFPRVDENSFPLEETQSKIDVSRSTRP